ncbi:MAG: hypothetical protein JEZ04_00600 [Spirochaetales bacterium]|nr:hypothetical protein [Spirochaetales bacterium]
MKLDALGMKLAKLMDAETELLNIICFEEEKLQKALRANNWNEMEVVINKLAPVSERMETIEADRDSVYQSMKTKLGKKQSDGFYSVAAHMDGRTREDCLSGYRKLKIALLRMRGLTSGIDQYVRTVGDTSRAVLNEVFPHRKGSIYSSTGSTRPVQSDPMVLNRHL